MLDDTGLHAGMALQMVKIDSTTVECFPEMGQPYSGCISNAMSKMPTVSTKERFGFPGSPDTQVSLPQQFSGCKCTMVFAEHR